MIDSKYTTLVFKTDTPEEKEAVREMAQNEQCRAWMLDHALLKLDLIEKAIEEKDLSKVEKYFSAIDVSKYIDELNEKPCLTNAVLTA